ncbi:MAG: type II secretion system protein N [Brevundimonas sp.]|uniref:type II secretion system protein N n=1 Tax=Brevundimonas sp. TaxID=1871086 RepID=UPI00391ACE14
MISRRASGLKVRASPSTDSSAYLWARLDRRALNAVVQLLLIVLIAVLLARLIWIVISPPADPLTTPAAALDVSARADRSVLARFDPFALAASAGQPSGIEGRAATAGAYRLHGLRYEAGGGGSAIIAVEGGRQGIYAPGDTLPGGGRLVGVGPDHAVIEQGGRRYTISFPSARTTAPVPGMAPAAEEGEAS